MRKIVLAAAVAGAALALSTTPIVAANDRADRRDDRAPARPSKGSTFADSDGDDGA